MRAYRFSLSRPVALCLPDALQSAADGKVYAIDPDFHTVLACLRKLTNPDGEQPAKWLYLAHRFYKGKPPPDADRLFAAFVEGCVYAQARTEDTVAVGKTAYGKSAGMEKEAGKPDTAGEQEAKKAPDIRKAAYSKPTDAKKTIGKLGTAGEYETVEAAGDSGTPLMDFEQDAGALYASFLQQYGIDLLTQKLHWFVFRELIAGLGEDTAFSARVRLRAMDETRLPPEERAHLRRLKEKVAIVPRIGKAEKALLAELDARLAAGENPDDVLRRLAQLENA